MRSKGFFEDAFGVREKVVEALAPRPVVSAVPTTLACECATTPYALLTISDYKICYTYSLLVKPYAITGMTVEIFILIFIEKISIFENGD